MRIPPNRRSDSTRRQLMLGRPRVSFRGLEQLVDEVDSRLHCHHEPFLQHPRQAQVRMSRRPWNFAAFGIPHESPNIMDLEPEQMSDAVWQKNA